MLISDACFAGSIFRTRAIFEETDEPIVKKYKLPSKKAMTSGDLKEVPDVSVFFEYFSKTLEENQAQYLSADKLFESIKPAVKENTYNVQQFGVIKNAGDQGDEFVFIRE